MSAEKEKRLFLGVFWPEVPKFAPGTNFLSFFLCSTKMEFPVAHNPPLAPSKDSSKSESPDREESQMKDKETLQPNEQATEVATTKRVVSPFTYDSEEWKMPSTLLVNTR